VLNTERAASRRENDTSMPAIAVVAAVLLMLVAGVEVSAVRRRVAHR
jgi:hypothetical protein